jgi:hypothetical protein
LHYLRQGDARSLAKVAAELGYKSTSRVESWSARYQWRERLLLWTKEPDDFEARFAGTGGRYLWPSLVTGRQGRPDSPQAWEAWLVYLGQRECRSYAAVAAALGKSKSLIARWGKRHDWPGRIRNAERRELGEKARGRIEAREPGEESWSAPAFDDELFQTALATVEAESPKSQSYEPPATRAELHRRIIKTLEPWLGEARGGASPFPQRLPLVSPKTLEGVSGADGLSLARTIREFVAFVKPVVARSETDEPLWHEEVIEHLEALQGLTSRAPLSGEEENAARGLLLGLEMIGWQLADSWFQQPQALEGMLDLLAPFFRALSHQRLARRDAQPHLQQLTTLVSLLPGTAAARQKRTSSLP